MRDLPDNLQFRSERLEPTFEYMVGLWFAQSQWTKKTYGAHSAAYVDSLQNWWWGMDSIGKLMIVCKDAVHAQVVISNLRQDIKRSIERELGIQFSFTDKNPNFRQLVAFELEFPELKHGQN